MILDGLRLDLQRELARLEAAERPRLLASFAGLDGGDVADRADRTVLELDLEQLEARIRRLRDRLAAPRTNLACPRRRGAFPDDGRPRLRFGSGDLCLGRVLVRWLADDHPGFAAPPGPGGGPEECPRTRSPVPERHGPRHPSTDGLAASRSGRGDAPRSYRAGTWSAPPATEPATCLSLPRKRFGCSTTTTSAPTTSSWA